MPFRVSADAFHLAATEAFKLLPRELLEPLDNVQIFVEPFYEPLPHEHPDTQLFGYYDGVALTERGIDEIGRLPDRIVLFQETFEEECEDWAGIVRELRITLVHEIAHHLGLSEERIHELGWG
ncbi:metallopeptidase family protein [Galactobacter valiniphilus]|uniref:metallopeptidase family protein n=1 Tax=Galactobacter valiniphilus TaxID=2676122 RepID=UPI003734EF23